MQSESYLRIIAYELAEGEPPYLRLPPIKAMYEIVTKNSPMISNKYSKKFQDFIAMCLQKVQCLPSIKGTLQKGECS